MNYSLVTCRFNSCSAACEFPRSMTQNRSPSILKMQATIVSKTSEYQIIRPGSLGEKFIIIGLMLSVKAYLDVFTF